MNVWMMMMSIAVVAITYYIDSNISILEGRRRRVQSVWQRY
ncbi:MAG: hypothetical protein QW572_03615 [Candidatus Nitrosocaldus sp.]